MASNRAAARHRMSRRLTCPRCRGTGKLPLKPYLARTMAAVPRTDTITAAALLRRLGDAVTVNAIVNRLEKLRALRLVRRRRRQRGDAWLYSRKC